MKFLKKGLAALLVVIFLLGVFPSGMIPTAGAVAAFSDVSGHWAANVINRWNGFGFINPEIFRGSNFWPNRDITRGEFFSLLVYALGASEKANISDFTDVYPDTWQYDIVAIANQMGIANGYPDGTMRPNDTLLRQEAATLAARAMGMSSVSDWTLSRFHDESSISPYARTFIAALVEEGVMSGYPNGTFGPAGYLTRAEAVKLLDNLFANVYMPESLLRNVYLQGGLLIQSPGAELRDVIIDGDVIIGDGVGEGNVVIADCTINGRLVVRGGGPNSITVSNTTISRGIFVASFSAVTRIAVTDNTTAPELESVSGFTLSGSGVAKVTILENAAANVVVNLDGVSLDELNINGPGAQVNLLSGHVINAKFDDAGQGSKLDLAANTSVGQLTISAPNAVVSGTGSIRNLLINNSGAVVAQTPEFLTLGLNITATVAGQSVSSGESQWSNNMIDRVSAAGNLKIELLPNTSAGAPFDQSSLSLNMVAGSSAAEVHVSQAASNRVPLTQRNNRWAFWVGFFVPAPPEAANMATVTYTYADGEPLTLSPQALSTYNGKQGLLVYLPVFREAEREVGLLKEVLYINWGGHLAENIHFMSSTINLAALNSTQKATLQADFDNMVMYSIQGGTLQYTGAEAVRRILASDNPLGLSSSSNRGLDAMNRAISSSEARSIIEDSQFAGDLTVSTGGNSQYSSLSDAGKQYVAEQVLSARKTIFANAAAVKSAFDKAVQSRLEAETSLLGKINGSGDAAALQQIIENTANAAVLQFQTGAEPYRSFTATQKLAMADYLWRLRQFRTIQDVIDAIKKYLGDPANAPGEPTVDDIIQTVSGVSATPSSVSVAVGREAVVTINITTSPGNVQVTNRTLVGAAISRSGALSVTGTTFTHTVNAADGTITIRGMTAGTSGRLTVTVGSRSVTINVTVTAAVPATGLTLDASEISLFLDGEYRRALIATLTPNTASDSLLWHTDNPLVATVSQDGMVTGVGRGTTTITVTSARNSNLSAECRVYVFKNMYDIIIEPQELIMRAGDTFDFQAHLAMPLGNTRSLVWSIQKKVGDDWVPDTSVARVTSSGTTTCRVTGVDSGNVKLRVQLMDGGVERESDTAEIELRSGAGVNVVMETSVMATNTTQEVSLEVQFDSLGNPLIPPVPGQRYYWSVRDAAIARITESTDASTPAILTGLGVGVTEIYLRTSAGNSPVMETRTVIVVPAGIQDVKFYNSSNQQIRQSGGFDRILKLRNDTPQTVRVTVQDVASDLNWIVYDANEYYQTMQTPSVDAGGYLLDKSGVQLMYDGSPVRYVDVFDTAVPLAPPGSAGYMRVSGTNVPSTGLQNLVIAQANVTRQISNLLTATGGSLVPRNNFGLAAIRVTPYRTTTVLGWDDLWFANLRLFEETVAGSTTTWALNSAIAQESQFRMEEYNGTAWQTVVNYTDPFDPDLVIEGDRRVVDANGQVLTKSIDPNPFVNAVVNTAAIDGTNVLYIWQTPKPPVIGAPLITNFTQHPVDTGVVNVIVTPGSDDVYKIEGVTNTTPESLRMENLTAGTSIVQSMQFAPFIGQYAAWLEVSRQLPGVYLILYAVRQNGNEGFRPIPPQTGDRQPADSLVSQTYSVSVTVTEAVTPAPVYLVPGDTGFISRLPGVAAAMLSAGLTSPTYTAAPATNLSVNPSTGAFTALDNGEVTIILTQTGAQNVMITAYVNTQSPFDIVVGGTRNLLTNSAILDAAARVGLTGDVTVAMLNSSNTSILSIDGTGVATGVAPGSTIINVTDSLGTLAVVPVNVLASGSTIVNPFPSGSIIEPTGTASSVVTSDPGDAAKPIAPSGAPAADEPKEPEPEPKVTELRLRTTAAIATGKTTRLEPYVTPYNTDRASLIWNSSNTAVATVSAGTVTGIKAGSAKITVTDETGDVKAECTVTVKADSKPVSSITMSKRTLALNVGAASALSVTFKPTNAAMKGITWLSNNSAVARVEPNGKVVAVSPGTAIITAISDSGRRTATCTVTVKIPVTSVKLPEASIRLKVGDRYQIKPEISPDNATDKKVTYTSNATSTASVSSSGLVSARKVGSATITVKVDGKSVNLRVTVVR